MKIKGVNKLPDFIQVRDEAFTLIAYFRADQAERALTAFSYSGTSESLTALITSLPYGRLVKP